MVYYITNGELYHHGTKGMKWGRRLFQNKDGSLTALGRARVKRQRAKNLEKARQARAEKVQQAKTTAEKKEEILKSRSAKMLYENAHLFDDRELQTAYNRLTLERNIKNLSPAEKSKVDKFVEKMNKTSDAIDKGSKLYDNVAKVLNAFTDSNLPIINAGKKDDKKDNKDDGDNNKKSQNNQNNNQGNKNNKNNQSNNTNQNNSDKDTSNASKAKKEKKSETTSEDDNSKGSKSQKTKTNKSSNDDVIDLKYDPETNSYGHHDDIVNSVNKYFDDLDDRPNNYGHYPEIVNQVNRYIDKLDRL